MLEVIVIEPNGSNRVFGEMRGDTLVLEGVPVQEGVGAFVVDGVRAEYCVVLDGTTAVLTKCKEVQDVPVV